MPPDDLPPNRSAERPEWRHAADAVEGLLADWMQDGPSGWSAPKEWTALSVPEFLLALLTALERHGARTPDAAGVEVVARAIGDARWTEGEPPSDIALHRLVAELRVVRDAAPPGPEDEDDDELVEAWWARSRMLRADPPDRLGAWGLWWAQDRLNDRLAHDDPQSTVRLLDRLLEVPGADLCAATCCGPLQQVLQDRGQYLQKEVANMCERHELWRNAVRMASPDNADDLDALRPWLP